MKTFLVFLAKTLNNRMLYYCRIRKKFGILIAYRPVVFRTVVLLFCVTQNFSKDKFIQTFSSLFLGEYYAFVSRGLDLA